MRVVLIFLTFVVLSVCEIQDEFVEFKEKYNRIYKNDCEEKVARDIFFNSKKEIDDHNEKYNRGETPYSRKIWKKSDLSREERKETMEGFVIPPYEYGDIVVRPRVETTHPSYPPGPSSINYLDKGVVGPIKDQMNCSSSWAFSAIGALESQLALKTGIFRNLSEQNLLDCNRNAKTGGWGCVGGSQASAYMYIKFNNGIASSEEYPYQGNDSYSCRYNAYSTVGTITGYTRIPQGDEILLKDIVAAVGPVAFGMDASMSSFASYSSGIYFEANCPQNLGHSATIIGYGHDDATGLDYWLAKNSWGTEWGENGFFKIARGYNMCGLTNYLIYPNVN